MDRVNQAGQSSRRNDGIKEQQSRVSLAHQDSKQIKDTEKLLELFTGLNTRFPNVIMLVLSFQMRGEDAMLLSVGFLPIKQIFQAESRLVMS